MIAVNKPLLRLAAVIHSHFVARRTQEPLIELPIHSWERCTDLARQLRRAQLRGWNLAASQLLKDLTYALPSVEHELTAIRQRLPRPTDSDRMSRLRDVYGDLVVLGELFAAVDFDIRARQLAVTTESIELEGVYLGPFKIQLSWDQGSGGSPSTYRVIATDPQRSESRDNVTHPHVMDEVLCEGDGRQAIRQALAQGRLLDFFTLVASVLRTYNSESPYVELALWRGSTCSDCGTCADEDCSYVCQKCDDTICSECETACGGCEESCCAQCISSCAACEESYCRRCLETCDGCQRRVCAGCLDDHERCSNCHEDESDEDESENCVPSSECAEIQPHSLGQAAIPAGCG